MKIAKSLAIYLIALALTINTCLSFHYAKSIYKHESILPELKQACATLQEQIDSITKITTVYANKNERLTRENEQKDMEIRALKDYIKGFDGFWKGDE